MLFSFGHKRNDNLLKHNSTPGARRVRLTLEVLESRTLLNAGDLDAAFGSNGMLTTDIRSNSVDSASAVAIQSDGKVVVVGTTAPSFGANSSFAVIRYNSNGTIDTGFGTGGDGRVITSINQSDFASGVVIQSDGKIVVVGWSGPGSTTDGSMVRYTSDGRLDSSFGSGGMVTSLFNGQAFTRATGVVLQPDGKIIVVGGSVSTGSSFIYAARVNTDGSLDSTFGSGGRFSFSAQGATSALVQPDGKIVIAGAGLLRLNANGSLDTTFASGGFLSTSFVAAGVALQPDSSIVVAGGRFGMTRYNLNGTLDTTFGTNGQVIGSSSDPTAFSMLLQPDGRIVLAGTSSTTPSTLALARYNPNGTLDVTFGQGGRLTTGFAGGNAGAASLALQTDGKIVAVGQAATNNGDFAVARYLPDTRNSSASQRYVSQVYLDLLQRPVEPAALTSWATAIDQNTLSRAQVALIIGGSHEYHLQVVQRTYTLILRRAADPSGLNGFTTFLDQGGTAEQLQTVLLGSGEYFNRRGDGSNNGFLQVLYPDVLHRPLDAGGAQTWNQILSAGASPGAVAAAILASGESDTNEVQAIYRQALRRGADAAGLSLFTNALQRGATNEQLLAVLIGSDEYFNRL